MRQESCARWGRRWHGIKRKPRKGVYNTMNSPLKSNKNLEYLHPPRLAHQQTHIQSQSQFSERPSAPLPEVSAKGRKQSSTSRTMVGQAPESVWRELNATRTQSRESKTRGRAAVPLATTDVSCPYCGHCQVSKRGHNNGGDPTTHPPGIPQLPLNRDSRLDNHSVDKPHFQRTRMRCFGRRRGLPNPRDDIRAEFPVAVPPPVGQGICIYYTRGSKTCQER